MNTTKLFILILCSCACINLTASPALLARLAGRIVSRQLGRTLAQEVRTVATQAGEKESITLSSKIRKNANALAGLGVILGLSSGVVTGCIEGMHEDNLHDAAGKFVKAVAKDATLGLTSAYLTMPVAIFASYPAPLVYTLFTIFGVRKTLKVIEKK